MNIVKKMYSSFIKWYDCHFFDFFECSIGDIILLRGYPSNNQLLLTSRLLDIEDYTSGKNCSFIHQNTISYKAYGCHHNEERGNTHFRDLIESYLADGYHSQSFVTCDNQLFLMDGNHRMGLHLFLGIDKVNVRRVRRKAKFHNGADWYYRAGLESNFIEKLFKKYDDIQSFLLNSGNTFCAVIGKMTLRNKMSPLYDLKHLTMPLMVHEICNGGGYLMQFSLVEPKYEVKNGNLVSCRVEEILSIMHERYGKDAPIMISLNCLEGKKMFEKYCK